MIRTDSARLVAEFQRRLRAFVSRRVRNPGDVEDVVQETFLRIHRHLPQVRSTDRLSAWVFQVARSALGDHYRRTPPPGEPLSASHEPSRDAGAAGSAQSASEFEELAGCLSPLIVSLPAADRQAIELSEIRGLTQRQAAARAGTSLSGMKSRVQRARRKLKTMLLACCRVELDRRGAVMAYEPRNGTCEPCGASSVSCTLGGCSPGSPSTRLGRPTARC